MKQLLLYFTFIFFFFTACKKEKNEISPAFYYWKQSFEWTKEDSLKANDLKLKSLYIKFFDVKKDNKGAVLPVSTLQNVNRIPNNLKIVPVVYLQNDIFNSEEPSSLAKKVFLRIEDMLHDNPKMQVDEYQIDCDWTASTRPSYFQFLTVFKSLLPTNKQISATIRLHQIKYAEKTGVPPVDKGLLMFYNMGDIKKINTKNSILDNKEGAKYLSAQKKYPLILDVALPIFEWSVLFQKNQFAAIFSDVNHLNINNLNFLKKEKDNNYICIKDTLFNNYYLRPSDKLRHEFVSSEELITAAKICSSVSNNHKANIIFFHWDKQNLQQYENNIFEKVLSQFE